MKLLKKIIILCIFFIIVSCKYYSNRPLQFNKFIWNAWDITFNESRYNMAIWLFKENWFNGKTKDIILKELMENNKRNHIYSFYKGDKGNILLFDLKYSNEFMERWGIDFDFKPIAYLRIYYNELNLVIRAELLEGKRKMDVEDYKIKKYWELK